MAFIDKVVMRGSEVASANGGNTAQRLGSALKGKCLLDGAIVIRVHVVRMKGKQSWQDPGPAWFAQAVVQANEGKIGDWGERVKLQYAIRSNETSDFTASHIGTKDVRKKTRRPACRWITWSPATKLLG